MRSDLIHRPGEGTSHRVGWCHALPESLSIAPTSRSYSFVRPATGIPSSRPEFVASAARRRRQGWPLGHRRRRRAASLMVPSTVLGWSEGRAISEHPMHDDDELAGERHLGLLHAGASGEPYAPTLELGAALERLGQDDVGGLVGRGAHPAVADLRDAAADVGLARLVLLPRHAEVSPD